MPTVDISKEYNDRADQIKFEYSQDGTMPWESFMQYKALSTEFIAK